MGPTLLTCYAGRGVPINAKKGAPRGWGRSEEFWSESVGGLKRHGEVFIVSFESEDVVFDLNIVEMAYADKAGYHIALYTVLELTGDSRLYGVDTGNHFTGENICIDIHSVGVYFHYDR